MNDLQSQILALAKPDVTTGQIAATLNCNRSTVARCLKRHGIVIKQRSDVGTTMKGSLTNQILALADGIATSEEIARQVGCSAKHVQTLLRANNASTLPQGGRKGELNHGFVGGRRVDLDGYILVSTDPSHPHARPVANRNYKLIYEHRLVLECHLGRYLLPTETVDHIDGLHLHNAPLNLRAFDSNADHLRATITGQIPEWSTEGLAKMQIAPAQRAGLERIDTYGQRKKRGVVRLQQILRAALQLGIDSPFLLGTLHHLAKAQIDYSSPTMIERALVALSTE
jgi:AraC-like DNA-binding protein